MRKFFRTRRPDVYNLTATELADRWRAWRANYDFQGAALAGIALDRVAGVVSQFNDAYTKALADDRVCPPRWLNTCGRTGGAGAGLAAEAGLADAEPVGPRGGDEPEAAVGHPDRI